MKEKWLELVAKAGVVGAGGAGFPTHVKLNSQVDTIVVNGAECEPLVRVDQQLAVHRAQDLVTGLSLAMEMTGATRGVIALKSKHKEAVAHLQTLTAAMPGIEVFPLGDFYPAGDEHVLVNEVTNRIVPEGGIPLQVQVVVINVETLINVFAAVKMEQPVTHTYVTITGAVAAPKTISVPLGTPVDELLQLAGGATVPTYQVVDGGPLMGKVVPDLKQGVTKTTKALLVLPEGHPVLAGKTMALAGILRQARSACCQCQLCTDLCPRHLLGHDLAPHKVMRVASYYTTGDKSPLSQVYLCSECGVCDTYACPMGLSPRRVNQAFKVELRNQGVKNPHNSQPTERHHWYEFRRIPTRRLVARLGLVELDQQAPLEETTWEPQQVELYLSQHVGAPAQPVIGTGTLVTVGQEVAAIPQGKLGAALHASISGTVEVKADRIVITRSGGEGDAS